MNLRLTGGRVPIYVGGDSPYILIDFPDRGTFDNLYPRYTKGKSRDRYWEALNRRIAGETFADVGKALGISRQAVRQIEAKFLRLISESYFQSKTASGS